MTIALVDVAALRRRDSVAVARLCESLEQHSAAYVRLPQRLTRVHDAAHRFFLRSAGRKRRCQRALPVNDSTGPAPVLVGWRAVNEAKELVRLFRGSSPVEARLPSRLSSAAVSCEKRLHAVLTHCMRCLVEANGCTHSANLRNLHRGNCALDMFWYPNERSCAAPNCGPHVDRGLLHALVHAPVEGLQIWDDELSSFRSPAALAPPEVDLECLRDVLVIVNASLQTLSHSSAWLGPRLHACVHQVGRAATPRLSISYEIRPAFGVCAEEWYGQLRRGPHPQLAAAGSPGGEQRDEGRLGL